MPHKDIEIRKEYKKKYYKNNLEKIKEYRKQYHLKYYKKNCEKIKEYQRQYNKKNCEKIKERKKRWTKNNSEKNRERAKQWKKDNPERAEERARQWKKDNPERAEERARQWKKDNPEYHKQWYKNNPDWYRQYIKNKRRTDLKYNLNYKMGKNIGKALKSNKAGRSWESLIGYNLADLIKRLSKTIPQGYTWKNYLNGELHIDHIIPISAFNFTRPEHTDFKRCWALSNLRLLPAKENLTKHSKLDRPFQPALKI